MPRLARIHLPPKSAMQSGRAGHGAWVLEFAPAEAQRRDPLMGWSGSGDTQAQVTLRFATKEAAVAYATAQGLAFEVEEPAPAAPIKPKAYADNFKFGRIENWSH